jgi:hypothetical protein
MKNLHRQAFNTNGTVKIAKKRKRRYNKLGTSKRIRVLLL